MCSVIRGRVLALSLMALAVHGCEGKDVIPRSSTYEISGQTMRVKLQSDASRSQVSSLEDLQEEFLPLLKTREEHRHKETAQLLAHERLMSSRRLQRAAAELKTRFYLSVIRWGIASITTLISMSFVLQYKSQRARDLHEQAQERAKSENEKVWLDHEARLKTLEIQEAQGRERG